MATSGLVIERFAQVSGFLPSTLDRMLRPLREAGLVPMGDRGRGQKRGQYEPAHLTNVILAFAGLQPSDAADAARALRPLVFAYGEERDGKRLAEPFLGEGEFGTLLDYLIDGAAHAPEFASRMPNYAFHLQLCLAPLGASITILGGNEPGDVRTDWYGPAQGRLPDVDLPSLPGVGRMTQVRFDVFALAAALWRDTLANRGEPLPDPVGSTTALPGAVPETKTAADASLPGEAPAAEIGDQCRNSELDGSSHAHPKCATRFSQSRYEFVTGRSHPPLRSKTSDHGSRKSPPSHAAA